MAWLAELLGLPAGWHGQIEDTASISTLTALAVARSRFPDRRVVVCSEQAHSSVDKAARLLELEVRKTPVDDEFRLRPDLLDLTGACAVVATVGTTSTTSVDPVDAIADRVGDVWLHVDAAYAGSAWVLPELRWSQAGVERADSLVVNAHKWLLVPMGCSCLWTQRPDEFRNAFSLVPGVPAHPNDVVSTSELAIPARAQLPRAEALGGAALLRARGAAGRARRARAPGRAVRGVGAGRAGLGALSRRGRSPSSASAATAPDEENEALLERVNATGELFISHTRLNGRYVLRLAVGNLRTTEDDVRRAWDVIRREGER